MNVHWRKIRAQGGDGFSLTELQEFPLAGLVARQGENLPFSGLGSQVETFFGGNARYITSCWSL